MYVRPEENSKPCSCFVINEYYKTTMKVVISFVTSLYTVEL